MIKIFINLDKADSANADMIYPETLLVPKDIIKFIKSVIDEYVEQGKDLKIATSSKFVIDVILDQLERIRFDHEQVYVFLTLDGNQNEYGLCDDYCLVGKDKAWPIGCLDGWS